MMLELICNFLLLDWVVDSQGQALLPIIRTHQHSDSTSHSSWGLCKDRLRGS